MENEKETAGKTAKKRDIVILSLKIEDAKMLSSAMQNIAGQYNENCHEKELAEKISKRIEKKLSKIQAGNQGAENGN